MNVTMLKSSSQFAGVSYNEKKVREGLRTPDGKHPLVEPMGWRNFPAPEGMLLTERAIIQTMKDWCVGGHARKNLQLHFVVSCRGQENTPEELKAAAEHLLDRFGYGRCPAVFYLHRDTDDLHLHVVTTTVNERKRKIPDFQNALHFARELDEYQRVDVEREVDDAVRKAMSYHFTSDRQFSLLLSTLGFQSGHRYEVEEDAKSPEPSKKPPKSIWAENAHMLFLYRYRKVVGRISMMVIRKKAQENLNKIKQDARREQRRKLLAEKMLECRLKELESFYSGKRPLGKKELRRLQKVRAIDMKTEGRMAERGIMRNDLYQMALFQDEVKRWGVDIRYNYDKDGIPNGFIAIDHSSHSVWKGSELGFSFARFLRPDEPKLWEMVREGRFREYMSAEESLRERGLDTPVALQVRNADGGHTYIVNGEGNASRLPGDVGRRVVMGDAVALFLTQAEMDHLEETGCKVHVKESVYDAIPREEYLVTDTRGAGGAGASEETTPPDGCHVPKGFIKASGPFVMKGGYYIQVDEIGGKSIRDGMCQICLEDFKRIKKGDMSLESAVVKYRHEEVMSALEDYFEDLSIRHGLSIEMPDVGRVLSFQDLGRAFQRMNDLIDFASAFVTMDTSSPGASYGGSMPKDVSKKKRRKGQKDEHDGMSY